MIFENSKVYDILKYIALIAVPAVSVFLTTIGKIWNIPNMELISATVSAFGVLLGALLQISSYAYNKAKINKDE